MLRIVAYGLILIALLVTIKSQRVLQRAHLVGACSTLVSAQTGASGARAFPGSSPAGRA